MADLIFLSLSLSLSVRVRVCVCVDLDFGVMGSHAMRTSASLAAEGRIAEARVSSDSCMRLLHHSRSSFLHVGLAKVHCEFLV